MEEAVKRVRCTLRGIHVTWYGDYMYHSGFHNAC